MPSPELRSSYGNAIASAPAVESVPGLRVLCIELHDQQDRLYRRGPLESHTAIYMEAVPQNICH